MILIRPLIPIRNWKTGLALLAMWLTFAVSHSAAQEATPKWIFEKADVFEVVLTQTTSIKSQVDQRVKDVDNQLRLNATWEVKSVSDVGVATMKMTLVSVQMKMESMPNGVGKSIEIDTSSDEKQKGAGGELLKQLAPLMGAVVNIDMSTRGEITNVVVPESTLESLREAPGSMKLRKIFESQGIQELFGQSVVVLPEDLQQNQPWEIDNQSQTGFGTFDAKHTCVWTGNRKSGDSNLAEFELKTEVTPRDESRNTDAKLTKFSGGGNLVFDLSQGHFLSSKSSNELTTEKAYREKTITTTVTTDVEMQIKKK
jgi:hypothetical protein